AAPGARADDAGDVLLAGPSAVAVAVGAAGRRAGIRALVPRIGPHVGRDAGADVARRRAGLAGARAVGRAAEAVGAEARDAVGRPGASVAGRERAGRAAPIDRRVGLAPGPPGARGAHVPGAAVGGRLAGRAAASGEPRAGAERGDREHRPRSGPPSSRHEMRLGGGVRPNRIRFTGGSGASRLFDVDRRLRAGHDPGDVGIFLRLARRPVGLGPLALFTALGLLLLFVLACQLFLALLEGVRPRSHSGPYCAPGRPISHLSTGRAGADI